MKTEGEPIIITHGKGAEIYDIHGKSYIDAVSSWWVNLHGHCNEVVQANIQKQLSAIEHVIFAGFTHPQAIQCVNELLSILPANQAKIFFSDNGSTAVEVALKMAVQFWHNKGHKKHHIIHLQNAYHGDTVGAMSVSGKGDFTAPFLPLLFDTTEIPVPNKNNIHQTIALLNKQVKQKSIAAFIFEPLLQAVAGMNVYEAEYLDHLMTWCKEHKIITIADEVMTGFGRLGKYFATDYLAHKPDIICLSKGLTAGFLPVGITSVTHKIYDTFYSDDPYKTFFHGHSYSGNALGCAAAVASIQLLKESSTQQSIQNISRQHQEFAKRIHDYTLVKEVRHKGTMLAIELDTNEKTSYFHSAKKRLYQFYLSQGVLLRPLGNVVYILPPYCISKEQLNYVYHTIEESLKIIEK